MPYNCKGDLYKIEIVKKLQNLGFDVKSVNALNKIMEKMGLLIHYGNGWGTTDAGARFSMWHKGVLNSDAWHPELVDEIAKFFFKSFNRFLIISLDVLICRYSPLFRAFPALFISEEPHKSFYYPLCCRSQK